MKKVIAEGAMMPRFYGCAYDDFVTRTTVCYPVPINILASWARVLWHWLRFTASGTSVEDRLIHRVYALEVFPMKDLQAKERLYWYEQYEQAYNRGYNEAIEKVQEIIAERLRTDV